MPEALALLENTPRARWARITHRLTELRSEGWQVIDYETDAIVLVRDHDVRYLLTTLERW